MPISSLLSFGTLPSFAGEIAAVGVLDLDHLGAEEREVQRGERTGEDVRQIEDADVR